MDADPGHWTHGRVGHPQVYYTITLSFMFGGVLVGKSNQLGGIPAWIYKVG